MGSTSVVSDASYSLDDAPPAGTPCRVCNFLGHFCQAKTFAGMTEIPLCTACAGCENCDHMKTLASMEYPKYGIDGEELARVMKGNPMPLNGSILSAQEIQTILEKPVVVAAEPIGVDRVALTVAPQAAPVKKKYFKKAFVRKCCERSCSEMAEEGRRYCAEHVKNHVTGRPKHTEEKAEEVVKLVREKGLSQRQAADIAEIGSSSVNRIMKERSIYDPVIEDIQSRISFLQMTLATLKELRDTKS